jgi:hypothetical protein
MALVKTNSMSTAINISQLEGDDLRSRNNVKAERPRRKLQKPPPNDPSQKAKDTDEKRLVKYLVSGILAVSCSFGIIATYMCEAAEETPQYDSNFHSTICQMFLGLAGVLAIIAPILTEWQDRITRRMKRQRRRRSGKTFEELIPSSHPKLFNALLTLSIITLLASAGVYPYSPIGSIPLGLIAGIAQNVATLLIVEGSGNKIMYQSEEIYGLESQLANYRRG